MVLSPSSYPDPDAKTPATNQSRLHADVSPRCSTPPAEQIAQIPAAAVPVSRERAPDRHSNGERRHRHLHRSSQCPRRLPRRHHLHGRVGSARGAVRRGAPYCGFGEKDRHTPPATVDTLARTLPASGVSYRYQVHKGADHGYALPDRDVYDKQSANRDWEIIFAMFHRRLRPYSM